MVGFFFSDLRPPGPYLKDIFADLLCFGSGGCSAFISYCLES